MNFSDIIGQSLLVKRLRSILTSGRIAHAYLLVGPAGAGKRTIADIFARALLCESEGAKPCDRCHSCRQYLTGNHPDIKRITLDQSSIKIDQIRELQQDIQVKPYQADRKVYIIENAQAMTVQAQNALLKTLEEPPSFAVLLLLADGTQGLLPTILSRCQILKLHRRTIEEIGRIIQINTGLSEDESQIFARLADGLPGRGLELARSQEFSRLREDVFAFVQKLGRQDGLDILEDTLFFLERRDRIDAILDCLTLWLRDLLVLKETGDASLIVNLDKISLFNQQIEFFTTVKIKNMIEEIERCRRMLKGNANFQLTIENMLLHFQGGYKGAVSSRSTV